MFQAHASHNAPAVAALTAPAQDACTQMMRPGHTYICQLGR